MIDRDDVVTSSEDEQLDRYLLALQQFAPSLGFEDRVLSRVRLYHPVVARLQERAAAFATPRRLWWSAGLAAAGSMAWTLMLFGWLGSSGLQATGGWLAANLAMPAWATAVQAIAVAARTLAFNVLAAYGAMGNALLAALIALMFLPAVSGWGLYFTVTQARGKRIAAHAVR